MELSDGNTNAFCPNRLRKDWSRSERKGNEELSQVVVFHTPFIGNSVLSRSCLKQFGLWVHGALHLPDASLLDSARRAMGSPSLPSSSMLQEVKRAKLIVFSPFLEKVDCAGE